MGIAAIVEDLLDFVWVFAVLLSWAVSMSGSTLGRDRLLF